MFNKKKFLSLLLVLTLAASLLSLPAQAAVTGETDNYNNFMLTREYHEGQFSR